MTIYSSASKAANPMLAAVNSVLVTLSIPAVFSNSDFLPIKFDKKSASPVVSKIFSVRFQNFVGILFDGFAIPTQVEVLCKSF
jgi:hypothetical protein